MQNDEQAIRTVHRDWIAAVNAGDLERLLALMTEDVVFLTPGRPPTRRDGFGPGFLEAHRQAAIRCVSELEEVVVVGEIAYTRSRDSLSLVPPSGGDATQLAGYRMTIYRRQGAGVWLLARDAHTLAVVKGEGA